MRLRRNLRHARLRSRRGSHCEPGAQLLEQRLVRNRRIGLADLGTAPVVHDRPLRRQSVAISGNQWQSERHSVGLSSTQQHSAALSSTQQHSAALRGTQRHSEALRGTQRHSEALRSTQWGMRTCIAGSPRNSASRHASKYSWRARSRESIAGAPRLWNGACNEDE
jgi:hypothetical protein